MNQVTCELTQEQTLLGSCLGVTLECVIWVTV
jgi:hypothetical protein